MLIVGFKDRRSFLQVSAASGAARLLEGWRYACPSVGLPKLFYASAGDLLYQGQFSATPPPQFLLDEPTYLSIVEFHSQKLSFIYEMISGHENTAATLKDLNITYMSFWYASGQRRRFSLRSLSGFCTVPG